MTARACNGRSRANAHRGQDDCLRRSNQPARLVCAGQTHVREKGLWLTCNAGSVVTVIPAYHFARLYWRRSLDANWLIGQFTIQGAGKPSMTGAMGWR